MLHRRRQEAKDSVERCPGCGRRHDDFIDPVTKRRWVEFPYELEAHECIGCDLIEAKMSEIPPERRQSTHLRWVPASSDDDDED